MNSTPDCSIDSTKKEVSLLPLDIYLSLQDRRRYRPVFEQLQEKVKQSPWIGYRAPVIKQLELSWIIANEDRVTDFLCDTVRRRILIDDAFRIQRVFLDKERTLCSQAWPVSILQAVFTRMLHEYLEPTFSPQLYSFRKGYGNHQAAKELGKYMQAALGKSSQVFVARRDVQQFDASIDKKILRQKFHKYLGNQDAFVWKLFDYFLSPKSTSLFAVNFDSEKGIPMGFHITPLAENLYLEDLDRAMTEYASAFYIRYGDDIVWAHDESEIFRELSLKAEGIVESLGLQFNSLKKQDYRLLPTTRSGVEYLGMRVYPDGTTFLSESKLLVLKKEVMSCCHVALVLNRHRSREEQMISIISSMNQLIQQESPYIDFAIRSATNTIEIKKLDVWMAKQVLRPFFKSGHDRVFRKFSLKKLRQLGLISLLDLHNKKYRM